VNKKTRPKYFNKMKKKNMQLTNNKKAMPIRMIKNFHCGIWIAIKLIFASDWSSSFLQRQDKNTFINKPHHTGLK